ncbi:hypothetical protein Nepgr_031138 [Nepenthes gracilis]|uniref:Uncharacterized protein n=1 Tax=Nepenthes gracilis TaxID=150966 RepID=A0AAD3Y6I4_NEPGR|nr:hypothetical protein Nepgr_031138 [Nepenthes gracilis]
MLLRFVWKGSSNGGGLVAVTGPPNPKFKVTSLVLSGISHSGCDHSVSNCPLLVVATLVMATAFAQPQPPPSMDA